MSDVRKVIADTKQWIEQEKVWGETLFASRPANSAMSNEQRGMSQKQSPKKEDPLPIAHGPLRRSGQAEALQALYERYKDCTRCQLGHSRIKFVFGVGNPNSEVLFIGEGPGYEEDRRGEPFVGKSGQLLDKMMAAIGLSRQSNAYIANIVKCHPMTNPQTPEARGNDRPPSPEEVSTCAPILLQQIAIMQPRVIMTLGSPSTKMILHTKDAITGLRGKIVPFDVDYFYPPITDMEELQIDEETRDTLRRMQVIPTYHPAALLRNPNLKPESWSDLKLLRDTLAKR
jgi:uracil-DNA glycosylase family 4